MYKTMERKWERIRSGLENNHVIDTVKRHGYQFITMSTVCAMDLKRKSIFSLPTSSQEKRTKVKRKMKQL